MDKSQLIEEAIEALRDFEVGREQLNERSAMTLLALLQLKPGDDWARATNPMLGTRAIMDWIRDQLRLVQVCRILSAGRKKYYKNGGWRCVRR